MMIKSSEIEVVNRKFRELILLYFKTANGDICLCLCIRCIHQHEKSEKFGIKTTDLY